MENPFKIILEKLNNIEKAIEKLNASSNIDDDFMNIEQVSSFISLSKTVYGLTNKRKIPYFKLENDCILKISTAQTIVN